MQAKVLMGATLLLAAALAGCTAQLDAEQTEPFRVRVEHVDGDGSGGTGATGASRVTVNVDGSSDDRREQRVIVDKDENVQNVRVVVTVTAEGGTGGTVMPPPMPPPTTDGNTTGGNETDGNATSDDGNTTGDDGNGTATTTSVLVVRIIVQAEDGEVLQQQDVTTTGGTGNADLTVNVAGKNNVVIITQAVQGAAQVDVDVTEAQAEAGSS